MYPKANSIALDSSVYIVASSGSRTENMSLLTTAAATILNPSFEPAMYMSACNIVENF